MLAPAAALGFFDGIVPVWSRSTLHQVRADRHVAATGSIEQPLMFEGNDLPGVMLCSGAERLAALYGVRPGKAAVVATTADRGLESALALHEAGVEIVGGRRRARRTAADAGARRADRARADPAAGAAAPWSAPSAGGGSAARWSPSSTAPAGRSPDTERDLNCDLVAVSGGTVPATSLLLQAGAKARWDATAGAYLPEATPAGHPRGRRGRRPPIAPRRPSSRAPSRAPRPRSRSSSATTTDRARLEAEREQLSGAPRAGAELVPAPAASSRGRHGKCFACLCEDVTTDDISYSIDEGFDSLELLKRYTTVTMGPCQGRMCQLASIRQAAADTRTAVGEVGLTTARPPWSSVPMGVLAGRPFEPAKRSAVHGRHRELGGNVLWAGRLAPALRLRRSEGRDDGRARGRRPDRRLDARQADRRAARRPAPSSTCSTRTASTT